MTDRLDSLSVPTGAPAPVEPRYCAECSAWTYNADHVCPVYDGPACSVCGEPTLFYSVGAPGYGSGRICRNGHDEPIGRRGIFTPEQTR